MLICVAGSTIRRVCSDVPILHYKADRETTRFGKGLYKKYVYDAPLPNAYSFFMQFELIMANHQRMFDTPNILNSFFKSAPPQEVATGVRLLKPF